MTGPMIDLERGDRRKERPAIVDALAARVVALEAALRDLLMVVNETTNRGSGKAAHNARALLSNAPKREET